MIELADVFAAEGALAGALSDYRPRAEQIAMAEAVANALKDRETLIVEAGTGIGKTLAYLVPALLNGGKVIVSTGTKTLQDQLYHRDLPLLVAALEQSVSIALLKGRANYLCQYRFERALLDGRFDSPVQAERVQHLAQWAAITRSGDLSEAPIPVLDESTQARITSTTDNCLGGECPQWGECFLMAARRRAQDADVLVVNHHLLLADWALKEGGHGEVLPAADGYVLDEAHQLPEVASVFFGVSVSSRQLLELVRDATRDYNTEAGDVPPLADALARLERAVLELRLSFGPQTRRGAWAELAEKEETAQALRSLTARLDTVRDLLEANAERGAGLAACALRAANLMESVNAFGHADLERAVPWLETLPQGFILRLTPLDVAEPFRRRLAAGDAAWIFTSATLSVGGDFSHLQGRLGIDEARTLSLASPFDYPRRALLYVPETLPPPQSDGFIDAFLDEAEQLLELSQGRAFLLFTSRRALRIAADRFRGRLSFPLLVQGDASQAELLREFRQAGNAVLLGTASFWEGVDVRGDALSLVMIDRLPFAAPSDPVLHARVLALREAGQDPFRSLQVPAAVIGLRQGAGRLIRDARDRGVLVIGDQRLFTRSYGAQFLRSLPPMSVTRDRRAVADFFAATEPMLE